jgi:hypothetical protein
MISKPIKCINIKSDGFESKLIHFRICKTNKECSHVKDKREEERDRGRKRGKKGGKRGGKKEGGSKEGGRKDPVDFRHNFQEVFPLC